MLAGPLLAAVLALLIGLTLGALGSGGSITALPVLVYVAGVDPRTAVAMSLVVVGAASLGGAILQWRNRTFHMKAAAVFGLAGIPGALLGAEFTHIVSPNVLMLSFALLLLTVGVVMWTGRRPPSTPGMCRVPRCAAIGFGVGVLTGFMGVGGGFLIVPALVLFAGVDTRRAVGTSMGIIAVNSASGLVRQIGRVSIDWSYTLIFLAAVLVGMGAGLMAARYVRADMLNRAMGGFLIVAGFVIALLQVFRGSAA
jgi:uncharacterized protein